MCNAQFVVQMSMELETFYRKPLEEHPYLIKPLLDRIVEHNLPAAKDLLVPISWLYGHIQSYRMDWCMRFGCTRQQFDIALMNMLVRVLSQFEPADIEWPSQIVPDVRNDEFMTTQEREETIRQIKRQIQPVTTQYKKSIKEIVSAYTSKNLVKLDELMDNDMFARRYVQPNILYLLGLYDDFDDVQDAVMAAVQQVAVSMK